jgi:hypothetical protein
MPVFIGVLASRRTSVHLTLQTTAHLVATKRYGAIILLT